MEIKMGVRAYLLAFLWAFPVVLMFVVTLVYEPATWPYLMVITLLAGVVCWYVLGIYSEMKKGCFRSIPDCRK